MPHTYSDLAKELMEKNLAKVSPDTVQRKVNKQWLAERAATLDHVDDWFEYEEEDSEDDQQQDELDLTCSYNDLSFLIDLYNNGNTSEEETPLASMTNHFS